LGDTGVLEHIVQKRGLDCRRIQLPIRKDFSDRDWVRDVGLAALAKLPQVRRVGEAIRLFDSLDVAVAEIALEPVGQRCKRNDGGGSVSLCAVATPNHLARATQRESRAPG